MSYLFLRTATFRNGAAMMAGMPLAAQIVELLKGAHKVDARLMVPAWSGYASRVSWVMGLETLNAFYEKLGGVQTNAQYGELVKRLSDHLEGPFGRDQIWREVPTAGSDKPLSGRFSLVRSLSFKNLNAMAAGLPVLKEIAEHVYKAHDAASRLYVPIGNGPVCRTFMVRRSDDLDKSQELTDKVMNDKKFRELLGRLSDFVDGSKTEDALWRSV
jgi:hypothetical protein